MRAAVVFFVTAGGFVGVACLFLALSVLTSSTSPSPMSPSPTSLPSPRPSQAPAARPTEAEPVFGFDVVGAFPHDAEAFTQGLVYVDGFFYESTGLNGRSSLRKVAPETGQVVQRLDVARRYFAEGLAHWDGRLVQLTWDTQVGFVYDRESFGLLRTFPYTGEGWGLAQDGRHLIMSDGTSTLRFLDPETLAEVRRVSVRDRSGPVANLNELEVVRGSVLANVWLTDRIARIDPQSGRVTSWIDLAGLRPPSNAASDAVLNGIAYDAKGDRLFVTGKLWSQVYEIRLRPRE
jgi:glutamine cyclotransferase